MDAGVGDLLPLRGRRFVGVIPAVYRAVVCGGYFGFLECDSYFATLLFCVVIGVGMHDFGYFHRAGHYFVLPVLGIDVVTVIFPDQFVGQWRESALRRGEIQLIHVGGWVADPDWVRDYGDP